MCAPAGSRPRQSMTRSGAAPAEWDENSIPHVHLDHPALALDRDDALLEGLEQRARIRQSMQLQQRGGVVVADDFDVADADDAVEQGLVEGDVLDVPELQRVDPPRQQAALVI